MKTDTPFPLAYVTRCFAKIRNSGRNIEIFEGYMNAHTLPQMPDHIQKDPPQRAFLSIDFFDRNCVLHFFLPDRSQEDEIRYLSDLLFQRICHQTRPIKNDIPSYTFHALGAYEEFEDKKEIMRPIYPERCVY